MTMQTKHKFTAAKSLAAVLCLMISLMAMQLTVWAVDLSPGVNTLTVSTSGNVFEYTNDLTEEAKVVVDLYKLADAIPVDGVDTYAFRFAQGYGDIEIGGVKMSDPALATGTVSLSNDQWNELALIASGRIRDWTEEGALIPNVSEMKSGPLGETGAIQFTNLNPGLYLIITHGSEEENYWSEQADGSVISTAQSANYTYSFSPSIISLPTKAAVDGVISTAAINGDWIYDASVSLKASVEPRYGSIQITKNIDKFEGNEEATFVFEITADGTFAAGEQYHYSNVQSVAFNASTGLSATVTVDHIRAGATVNVREVDSGRRYTAESLDWQEPQVVVADDPAVTPVTFTFTNYFNGNPGGGHGIQNHFTYEETSWTNTQQTAASGLYR